MPIDAVDSYNLNIRMRDLASFFIGVRESAKNAGPIVEQFQRAVDGVAQGEPWCMGLLQYLAKETARVHGGVIGVKQSESVLQTWNGTDKARRREQPAPGYWALWQMGDTWFGHAGIVKSVVGDTFQTIEGNTSGGSGMDRDGDGVWLRSRRLVSTPEFKLLGFLKVFD
jgi:hypothetical protein